MPSTGMVWEQRLHQVNYSYANSLQCHTQCLPKWLLDENLAAAWQNQTMICAPSEDSDQPGHPPSLIRVFAVRLKQQLVLSYPLSAQRRLWSADLRWAQMSCCWFGHEAVQNTSSSSLKNAAHIHFITFFYISHRQRILHECHFIRILWNEPSSSFIYFIWNHHECKILFSIWPF